MINFSPVTIKLFKKSIFNFFQSIPQNRACNYQSFAVPTFLISQQYYSKDARNPWNLPEHKGQIKRPQIKINRPNLWNAKPPSIKVDKNLEFPKPAETLVKLNPILQNTCKENEPQPCFVTKLTPEVPVETKHFEETKVIQEVVVIAKISDESAGKVIEENVGRKSSVIIDDGGEEREKSWKNLKRTLLAFAAFFAFGGVSTVLVLGGPKADENGEEIVDDCSKFPLPLQYLLRTFYEIMNYTRIIIEPSREKLLPDVLAPPYYQPPYTLVMEFTDVLVHPEWTYSTGWRFKKRPGLDYFLETLCSKYELVVYTAEMGMTVFPIVDALDKKKLISYKLVRDSTNFLDGHHVKDLDKLNRDLSKVVVIDWNPESTKLHNNNLFKIPRWDGNDDDTVLYDLTSFLLTISNWEIEDVRAVLNHYGVFENPLENFKEKQRSLLEAVD